MLSPDVLAQIVDQFGARADPVADLATRFPLRHCPARAYIRGSSAPAERVELVDLATQSVGFTSQTLFIANDAVLIELDVPGIPRQIWPCRVVRTQVTGSGAYRIGACFEPPVT